MRKDKTLTHNKIGYILKIFNNFNYTPFTSADLRKIFPDMTYQDIHQNILLSLDRLGMLEKMESSLGGRKYFYKLKDIEESTGHTIYDLEKIYKLINTKKQIEQEIATLSKKGRLPISERGRNKKTLDKKVKV